MISVQSPQVFMDKDTAMASHCVTALGLLIEPNGKIIFRLKKGKVNTIKADAWQTLFIIYKKYLIHFGINSFYIMHLLF